MLHNNALNIGLKMSDVKLPKIEVDIKTIDTKYKGNEKDKQISESCVLSYLGQRGYAGFINKDLNDSITIKRNAVPLLVFYTSPIKCFAHSILESDCIKCRLVNIIQCFQCCVKVISLTVIYPWCQ